jgi:hypothetical protein
MEVGNDSFWLLKSAVIGISDLPSQGRPSSPHRAVFNRLPPSRRGVTEETSTC